MTGWLVAAVLSAAVAAAPLPPQKPVLAVPPMPPAKTQSSPTAPVIAMAPSVPGMVCRDPRLFGEAMPNIVQVGALACGIENPVRVSRIGRITLSQPIVIGCTTARRLADWLTGVAQPAARDSLGAGISGVEIMGSYACRRRNNAAGGSRSEHARGRAVDIGGFTLTDGRKVTVAGDWDKGPPGEFLRSVWQKGCGPFATVLGPEADSHHRDHFHLDTSPRGGAPYCR